MIQSPPARSVRSFVRRQGRMTERMHTALQTLMPRFGLQTSDGVLDFDTVFGRRAPRVLEIGFGNGDALIQMAQQNPEWDYLGVDVHRPGVANVLQQTEQLGLANVRVICADAIDVLERQIATAALHRILIFFPDPWPKRRHHKRRLIQTEFVERLVSRLAAGGILHLATDWQPYAQQMMSVLQDHPGLQNLAGRDEYSPRPAYRPLTKYEQRGHRQGHHVYDLLFRKVVR